MGAQAQRRPLAGVIGFFDDPSSLIAATEKTRDAKWESFETYTPFPVHGLEQAQGLKRSWIPYVTMAAGLAGGTLAFSFEYWTSVIDWPIIIGGKPLNSWPAFVPIIFELTVLFAALSSVAAMFLVNRLPNITQRIFDPSLTRDRFAIVIEAPASRGGHDDGEEDEESAVSVKPGHRAFQEAEAADFLRQLGARDVRTVYAEGWF